MPDSPSKAERLAQSAVLTLIARGALALLAAAMVPTAIGLLDMRTEVKLLRADLGSKVDQVEQRLSGRIATIEDRQGAQSRRMDLTDTRIERLADITGKFAVDTAVLAEQIRALIAASQPPRPVAR